MKLSEIEEGMTLVWGSQRNLADGRYGKKVLVKGVGPYTIVRATGCPGYKAVKADTRAKRVWIEKDIEHVDYSVRPYKSEMIKADEVVSHVVLMPVAEYEAKRKARESVEDASKAHDKEGNRIRQAIADLLAPHVPKLNPRPAAAKISHGEKRGQYHLSVYVDDVTSPAQLAKLPKTTQRKLAVLLDELWTWERSKNPGAC